MDDKKIARINELYHKSKAGGLTTEEAEEQKVLRQEYLQAIRQNVRSQLDQVSILEKDGTITHLGRNNNKKLH